jgi:hypothetical protein
MVKFLSGAKANLRSHKNVLISKPSQAATRPALPNGEPGFLKTP